MSPQARLLGDGRVLRLTWPDGAVRDFAARWLFDHAEGARDALSGQRGHGALALEGARTLEAATIEGDRLRLRFAGGAERRPRPADLRGDAAPAPATLWTTPEPMDALPAIAFADYLQGGEALREALSSVARLGLTLLAGAGPGPDVVERAAERFGFVRETNYGRVFDVRIEPEPGNLAYTDRPLDLHTDNPYRDPVPTLQLLHAITSDDAGAETLFVDGFAHAEALRREEPAAFNLLARQPVRFTFAAASGERWSHAAPVIGLGPDGRIEGVRVNHRSLDLEPGDPAATDAWYDAYLAFYRRLHAPGTAYERRLRPGEVVIFDNRRLLHGRRALTSGSPRWLRGCYADADGLAATLARLQRTPAREPVDA